MSELKVEVISNVMVTQSHPTPPNRKTMVLSFVDESFPSIHVPTILVYTNIESTKPPLDNIISVLKASLSETLTQYYPLAGRFENQSTVSCNNQGIPFIVTCVDCQINDFLNSPHKFDLLSKFFPSKDMISFGQPTISTIVPLAIQVNLFGCGGVAIGCYYNHKLFDATSMSSFLNYWAAHASGRYEDLVEPDFDTVVRLFPSSPKETRAKTHGDNTSVDETAPTPAPGGLSQRLNLHVTPVAKSFKFNNNVIKELKANGASETVPNPTSFEVVAGFVWKHAIDAIVRNNNDNNKDSPIPSTVTFSAGLRSRIKPPISKHCIGNITAGVEACLGDEKGNYGDHKLQDTVRLIHAAVQTTKQKLEIMLGENGRETFIAERKAAFKAPNTSAFTVWGWCKLGFNEVNFGFGKPTKVIPLNKVYPFLRNNIMLLDYTDSNDHGIEVFVYLEQNEMSFLEDNAEFKAFAVPS